MALAAYMDDSSSGQKWFSFKGPGGSVTERALFESIARRAASDRLGCDESELIPHAPDEQTRRMMEEIARKMER